jgi:tetratricopeptide (TPR) repeat protein
MEKLALNKNIFLSVFILFLGIFAAFCSAYSQTEEEFLYPTLISANYKDGSVLISFEPAGNKTFRYRIYRSATPIENKQDLKNAMLLAEITEEKIPYKDSPVEGGKYYYAVTAVKQGMEYTDLVPYQNITLNPVDYSPVPDPVQRITVSTLGNHLVGISFAPVRENYTYRLYVSSKRIDEITDINPLSIQTAKGNRFEVEIEEDKPYYFFVSTVNRLKVENKTIVHGNNATSHEYIMKKAREKPPEIKKKKKPATVSADKLIEDNLKNNFYNGNYSKALKDFQNILTGYRLSASQRGATHFYMAQCYYYRGNYEKAVRYFILSKEISLYKDKADTWIDRCLENIE